MSWITDRKYLYKVFRKINGALKVLHKTHYSYPNYLTKQSRWCKSLSYAQALLAHPFVADEIATVAS